MKRYLSLILFIALLSRFTACSTKIDTSAPYQSTTFVYGLLDIADTAHYVRIQKAFLSQTLSAYDMAKVPDSSFYLNLDVRVKEINPVTNTVINTFTLEKVNMNNEGYTKDSGIFFTDPSYAYKFKRLLSSTYRYRLIIHNLNTGETDSAQTVVLNDDPTISTGFKFSLLSTNAISFGFNPNPDNDYIVTGNAPDSSLILQMVFRYKWVDKNIVTGVETDQYYDWNFGSFTYTAPVGIVSRGFSLKNNVISFVITLRDAMGNAPPNTQRYLDSPDAYIYAGPATLYNYQVSAQNAGLGITGSSIQPIFSNIAGRSVYGIFSSKAQVFRKNIPFEGPSFNYIVNNALMGNTGIQQRVADH